MGMDAIKVTGVAIDPQQQVQQSALTNPMLTTIGDYAIQAKQLAQATGLSRGGPGLGFENAFAKITNNLDRTFRQGLNTLASLQDSGKQWAKLGAVLS